MKSKSFLILSTSPPTLPARKLSKTVSLPLPLRRLRARPRRKITGKERDPETGLYYYGARYLDPKASRWLSGDPAVGEYIPSAPINDEARRRNGGLPGMGGVFNYVNLHVYHYAGNNPVRYTDPDGKQVSEEETVRKIQANIQNIMGAAEEFGVDPVIIAGCIYAEQRQNVDFLDNFDILFYFIDTSIGLGQVKISTARMLEDNGLIERTESFSSTDIDFIINIPREQMIAYKLDDDRQNIRYIAAYLKHHQDRWRNEFPEIGERPDILGTLYNIGDRPPRATPESRPFGDYVQKNYEHVKNILGIE